MRSETPIAIVGAGAVVPGARDVDRFWANIRDGVCAARPVTPGRWVAGPEVMVRPGFVPDRAYSDRLCPLPDLPADPWLLAHAPELARGLDPMHRAVLAAGRQAIGGERPPKLDPERTGVVLAAIVLPTDGTSVLTASLLGGILEEPVAGAAAPRPLDPGIRGAARVVGYPAALLARALGLHGGAYTLDAACASSLYAVKLACDALRSGEADAMLAGGVSRPDSLFTQVGFSQLRALSPSGRCAPFDRSADGLVVGEGAGVVVLKRLADARRDGDPVLAIVAAVGLSNDTGGNLLAPDTRGQLRAMTAAYEAAGWEPSSVDLIECHGAGTPVGDAAELSSLRALWGATGWRPGECPIGSVKSNVGHLLTAAGAAGLIKLLAALAHGILPPSLNFTAPPEASPLIGGPFRVQTECAPWERRKDGSPRRAALSAFGFGGINAHLLLEEERGDPEPAAAGRRFRVAARPPAEESSDSRGAVGGPEGACGAIAIVGMAAFIGRADSTAALHRALVGDRSLLGPRPPGRWKGCDRALDPRFAALDGNYLDTFSFDPGAFRIPPREVPDILPQHLLMMRTAAAAMDDAGIARDADRPRMGALIGLDFDFEAAGHHLRWLIDGPLGERLRERLPRSDPEATASWLERLKDAASPPLTATATLGALGSMAASRIARALRCGGMSFTVSCRELSGLRALAIASAALAARELDLLLVGAVDLCGELRRIALEREPGDPFYGPGDGAAAVVLKRLEDALNDGDRIHAVIAGIGAAAGTRGSEAEASAFSRALAAAGGAASRPVVWFRSGRGASAPPAPVTPDAGRGRPLEEITGELGALAGLAALVAAALSLGPEPSEENAWAAATAVTAEGESMAAVLRPAPKGAGRRLPPADPPLEPAAAAALRIPVAGRPIVPPPFPGKPDDRPHSAVVPLAAAGGGLPSLIEGLTAVTQATAEAHAAFLEASARMSRAAAEAAALAARLAAAAGEAPGAVEPPPPPPAFDRAQCLEFARGSAARVLGPDFSELDRFPVRVRLPDEPLMLVDRILRVEGEKGRLGPGRIVTEHDVLPGAWYLDGGRAPVCIAVEAGQADLFLCAWLGIDLVVRGRRAYRLLDATVEFHRGLPLPGETIRYDIAIERFLRQGETHLFLFRFTGTIAGAPLITMTGGCAGFFTPEEVENSGGILPTQDTGSAQGAGALPPDWSPPVPVGPESYDDRQIEALRRGDLGACFGGRFRDVSVPEAQRLPGGRMALIHRVLRLDPCGGRYGIGRIEAEADIHADDWFLTCHFADDPVMPGTLMYECCSHALRVFLQRLGWVSESPAARFGPLAGRPATLKCRGPVTPATRRVLYRIDIRELGYGPEPYAIADADMLADGRHIVHFTGMSLALEGTDRGSIERFWSRRPAWDRGRLLEFAAGSPSRAFGERYRPFDAGRFIARLPSPPYLFIDRITAVEAEPWELKAGGAVTAEVDIAPQAWYLAAEGSGRLPFCVLLEAALQPCGWLAAFMGSALRSEKPLHFRNLGGSARLLRPLPPGGGTLTVRSRLTQVAEVVDMLIEHFDFRIDDERGPLYEGSTYFGFFTPAALARQEGLRDAPAWAFRAAETAAEGGQELEELPPLSPEDPARPEPSGLALPGRALRMIDRIEAFDPRGGPHGCGYVCGVKRIDPQEWFFTAHFRDDPVCPGSLGIDSFIQLLKYIAIRLWPDFIKSHRFTLAGEERHRWVYRGQVLPRNRLVRVEAAVTRIEEGPEPALFGEGHLMADGLVIYRMENFGVRLREAQGVEGREG